MYIFEIVATKISYLLICLLFWKTFCELKNIKSLIFSMLQNEMGNFASFHLSKNVLFVNIYSYFPLYEFEN